MKNHLISFLVFITLIIFMENCKKSEGNEVYPAIPTRCYLTFAQDWTSVAGASNTGGYHITYKNNKPDSIKIVRGKVFLCSYDTAGLMVQQAYYSASTFCSLYNSYYQNYDVYSISKNKISGYDSYAGCMARQSDLQETYTSSGNTITRHLTTVSGGLGVDYTEVFTYYHGNIVREQSYYSGQPDFDISYEYDDKINPFSKFYFAPDISVPLAELLSINNITKITRNCSSTSAQRVTNNIHYTYNSDNLPVTVMLEDSPNCSDLCYGSTVQPRTAIFQYYCP